MSWPFGFFNIINQLFLTLYDWYMKLYSSQRVCIISGQFVSFNRYNLNSKTTLFVLPIALLHAISMALKRSWRYTFLFFAWERSKEALHRGIDDSSKNDKAKIWSWNFRQNLKYRISHWLRLLRVIGYKLSMDVYINVYFININSNTSL